MSSNKKIIALVGMPGSGKSTVLKTLVNDYRFPSIYFGKITMEEMEKRNLAKNQENEKLVRQELRENYGMAAYAQLSLPKIKTFLEQGDVVLIDGLYSWSEYILLKKANFGQVVLVSVIASRPTRYQRLAIRKHRPLSATEAEKRDFAEIEKLDKGGPIALCDYYITNDLGQEELKKSVHQLAQQLGFRA